MFKNRPSFNAILFPILSAILGAALLAGCASGPTVYEIRGEADPMVNRDVSGAPLSVVVRLYQLKDGQEFSKLTFDTIAGGRPETELLGAELLEKNEVVLVPGNKHTSTDKLREDTKYVGVVAFFRRPDQHYWRYLVDADKVRSNGLTFRAHDCYLSMLNVKPVAIPGQPLDAKPDCAIPQVPLVTPAVKAQATQEESPKPPAPGKKRKTKASAKLNLPKGAVSPTVSPAVSKDALPPVKINVRVPAPTSSLPALPAR
jgi:type VI secretion system protein VasD